MFLIAIVLGFTIYGVKTSKLTTPIYFLKRLVTGSVQDHSKPDLLILLGNEPPKVPIFDKTEITTTYKELFKLPPIQEETDKGVSSIEEIKTYKDLLTYRQKFGLESDSIPQYEREIISTLLKEIVSDDSESIEVRGRAAVGLSQVDNSDNSLETIASLLNEDDDKLITIAAQALKFSNNPQAVPYLINKLDEIYNTPDDKPEVTRSVSVALGKYNSFEAQEKLRRITKLTNRSDVFGSAIHSLGEIGNFKSIEMINEAWEESKQINREQRSDYYLSCLSALRGRENEILEAINSGDDTKKHLALSSLDKILTIGNGWLKNNSLAAPILSKSYFKAINKDEKKALLGLLFLLKGKESASELQKISRIEKSTELSKIINEMLAIKASYN